MKTLILVPLVLIAVSFTLNAQGLEVVSKTEINVKVKVGQSESFEFTVKNTAPNPVTITNIRFDEPELEFTSADQQVTIKPGEKKKLTGIVQPRYKGKQRFQVYVDYKGRYVDGTVNVTVAINP